MHAQCIDLKERFGRRFRVAYEESYRASYGLHATRKDPWLQVLLCRYGHIYTFGGERLAASVDGHANVAGVLRRLPCCTVHQDGDLGELTVVFNVADFAKVAKIMQPRRSRRLSPQAREALVQAGMVHRFLPRGDGVQSDLAARPRAAAAQADSQAIPPQRPMF